MEIFLLSFFLLVMFPTILVADKPVFDIQPNDFYSDSTLSFECHAKGTPKPIITWFDADTMQPAVAQTDDTTLTGIHINNELGSLSVVMAEQNTIYRFFCRATNSDGVTDSRIAQGRVFFLDRNFKEEPESVIVHDGDTIIMKCEPPSGFPIPTVTWLHNGQPLDHVKTSVKQPNLEIKMVQEIDGGVYVCRVKSNINTADSGSVTVDSRIATLTVIPSTVARKIKNVEVGDKVIFQCQTSQKTPMIWRRLNPGSPIDPNRSSISEESLILRNIIASDRGLYTCEVEYVIRSIYNLQVNIKPGFVRTPEDVTANENSRVQLDCETNNHEVIELYWTLPSNKDFIFMKSHPKERFIMTERGSLIIDPVLRSDEGTYKCTAYSINAKTDATAKVTVIPSIDSPEYPVIFSDSNIQKQTLAPLILLPPADTVAVEGDELTLTCVVDKDSKNTISWNRATYSAGGINEVILMSQVFDKGRIKLLANGNLKFSQILKADTGNYTCLVESGWNHNLKSNWTSTLSVLERKTTETPLYETEILSSPTNLKWNLIRESKVANFVLEWDPPKLQSFKKIARPIRYRVEVFQKSDPKNGWMAIENEWKSENNTITINGLQPNEEYYFVIRPKFAKGRVGWASEIVGPVIYKSVANSFDIIQDVLIRDVQISHLGSPTVRLTWSLDHDPNLLRDFFDGFEIKYAPIPILKCISDLQSSQLFGEFCSLNDPSFDSNDLFMERLRYMQNSMDISSKESIRTLDFATNTHNYQIILQDLIPFTCYQMEIKLEKKPAYFLNSSRIIKTLLTHEAIPNEAPIGLCVKWLNESSIEIMWEALTVSKWNGILTGYSLYVNDESEKIGNTSHFDYRTQSAILTNLKSPGPFFITIAAMNCRGPGLRSRSVKLERSDSKGASVGWGCLATHSARDSSDTLIIGIVSGSIFCGLLLIALICCCAFCRKQRRLTKKCNSQNPVSSRVLVETPRLPETKPLLQMNGNQFNDLQVSQSHDMRFINIMHPQPPSYQHMGGVINPLSFQSPHLVPQMLQMYPQEPHYASSMIYDNQRSQIVPNFGKPPPIPQTPYQGQQFTMTTIHSSSSGGGPLDDSIPSPQQKSASGSKSSGAGKGSCSSAGSSSYGANAYCHVTTGLVDINQIQPKQFDIPPPPIGPPPPCPIPSTTGLEIRSENSYCDYDNSGAVYDPANGEEGPCYSDFRFQMVSMPNPAQKRLSYAKNYTEMS